MLSFFLLTTITSAVRASAEREGCQIYKHDEYLGAMSNREQTSRKKILMFPHGYGYTSNLRDEIHLTELLISSGYDVTVLINNDDVIHLRDAIDNINNTTGLPGDLHFITFPYPEGTYKMNDTHVQKVIKSSDPLEKLQILYITRDMHYSVCRTIVSDSYIVRQLTSSQYDVFIVDIGDHCSMVLASWLDLPLIGYSAHGIHPGLTFYPDFIPFVPSMLSAMSDTMNFQQRVSNILGSLFFTCFINPPNIDMRKSFAKANNLTLQKSVGNIYWNALLLTQYNFVFEYPRPFMPNVIPIGGWHATIRKPLAESFTSFIEKTSSRGLIYIAFGTTYSDHLINKTQVILESLSCFPDYQIIWKDTTNYITPPSNILMTSWAPQNDLLSHPQMKLFITHAGIHSSYEALVHGVPVVAIPMGGDQYKNAIRLTHRLRMGVQVDFSTLTVDSLVSAISQVLNNTTYSNNAADASEQYHYLLPSPRDKILSAVHFVIKHKGIGYLASKPLSYYSELQLYGVDVAALIILCIFVIFMTAMKSTLIFIKYCCKKIIPVICGKKKTE